ncbi:hypothetical protein HALLA_20950 (plasmid) [Halostagnicola larsenii XH-48]|uniref:Uncharacterized protein n=1 Tax=Halostagnicola larsenii XH-48 TaxID=797299 RepID=W0JYV2_9EURY|nr:hypothetical protein [Halostagnicola larsenii]AHG02375.1 hypothetical protein HALLA_20950 [Halostagnicola larsenii XH-48]
MTEEKSNSMTRRTVLRSTAAAGVAGAIGTSAIGSVAGEEVEDETEVKEAIEEHAGEILKQLAEGGVLSSASADELPTDAVTTDFDDEGVERVANDGDSAYIVRKETDDGLLALFVDTDGTESIAAFRNDAESDISRDGGHIDTFSEPGSRDVEPQSCEQTDACPGQPGVPGYGFYAGGYMLFCC